MMADLANVEVPRVQRLAASAIFAALLVAMGCGERSGRLAVSGEVTLDGKPLDRGSIRFSSQSSTGPMATGALIRDGAYFVPADKGLLPGKYHVEITSPDEKAPPIMDRGAPGGPGMLVAPDRIPPEYNSNSDKTIEVTLDGDNEFDFTITTRSAIDVQNTN